MPYKVVKRGNRFAVVKVSDGKTMGKHESRAEAEAQVRALYAAERRRKQK